MPKANSIGDFMGENVLALNRPVVGTDPIVIVSPALDWMDGISFQVKLSDYVQPLLVEVGDEVAVTTDGTWTFANGVFHADMVGGTITVAGAAEATNNGEFEITAVNSATEIETAAGTLVDEVFTASVSVTVTVEGDPAQATLTVYVSDNFVRPTLPGLNQVPYTGDWSPVSTKFANTGSPFFPAIAAITADTVDGYQMSPLMFRFVRWTLTPASGISNYSLFFSSKGNR